MLIDVVWSSQLIFIVPLCTVVVCYLARLCEGLYSIVVRGRAFAVGTFFLFDLVSSPSPCDASVFSIFSISNGLHDGERKSYRATSVPF